MNIMNRVTLQYLGKNRRRTVVTILGVIISAAMIAAVSTLIDSFLGLMQRECIYTDGDWHIQYLSVSEQDTEKIRNNQDVALAGKSREMGYFKPANTASEGRSYLHLVEGDTAYFELKNLRLVAGRLPQAPGEILVTDQNEWGLQPGDTLSGSLGWRKSNEDGERIKQNRLASPTGDEETFVLESTASYQVVGIYQGFENTQRQAGDPSYTLVESASEAVRAMNVTVRVKNPDLRIFKDPLNLSQYAQGGMEYHDDLLRYMGILQDDGVMKTLYTTGGIVAVIILIGSVLLIYNAFAISISERSRQLGMLASVGATKRQKRNSVFFEGAVIGIIAIPLGLLFGILGIGVTFYLISPLIQDSLNLHVPFQIAVSVPSLLGAAFFSVLTIFISVLRPALRASRITPIDAIRQTQDVHLSGKAVRTSLLLRRLFGFEGELAMKNLKRNKKRYQATILSLTVSLLLFLTASSFTHFLTKSYELTDDNLRFDLSLTLTSDNRLKIEEVAAQAAALTGVRGAALTPLTYLSGFTEIAQNKLHPELIQISSLGIEANRKPFQVQITTMDDQALARYCETAGIDPKLLSGENNPAILIGPVKFKQNYQYQQLSQLQLQNDEALELSLDLADKQSAPTGATIPLTIVTQSPEIPIYLPATTTMWEQLTVIVSNETYWALYDAHKDMLYGKGSGIRDYNEILYLQSSQADTLEAQLEQILADNQDLSGSIFNVSFQIVQMNRLTTLLSVFIYGFISLISLISVATIFNTISTSVALRKREFAMLKSVGMTPGGFTRMIRYESLFYGLKALLYGLPLGLVLSFLLYRTLDGNFSFSFSLPWISYLFGIACIFLIVGATMLYATGKLKHSGIVDALTDENL